MSKKVKHDKIILGAMAGAAGGAIGLVFSYTMYLLGISPMASLHLAAAPVVTDIINLTPGGVIWSIVTHCDMRMCFLGFWYARRKYFILQRMKIAIGRE